MLLEYGQGSAQLAPSQHVHVLITASVGVGSENPAAQESLHTLQRRQVSTVKPDLEGGLLAITGEGSLPNDQPHGEPERECIHAGQDTKCATSTQGGTFHILGREPYLGGPDRNCQRAETVAMIVSCPGSTGTLASAAIASLAMNGRGGAGE